MAATGYTPISLYYSTTASAVPTAGNLANGELALNIADMKLYAKNSAGTVTLLASNASTTGVDSLSFGSTGLTPSTATTGAITVAGTLATTNGGTGLTSFTANGVLYASSTSALTSGSALTFDGTNLGLGVTPSAWGSVIRALQVNNTGMSLFTYTAAGTADQYAFLTNNSYQNSSYVDTYVRTNPAAQYRLFNGTHAWYTAPSGTAGNAITFTEALTLQNVSQQNLTLRGTNASMVINSTNGSYPAIFVQTSGTTFAGLSGDGTNFNIGANGYLAFQTSNLSTERVRISAAGGFSVGTTADPGAGAIYATGAITAYYSDERLKDVKGRIQNALAKVRRLSGVYYTNNETAKALGYTSDEMQVGVLANQMKGELPEIVKPAPFDLDENGNSKSGQNYMTVQYERGFPLLIEALKELADQFDDYVATH